MLSTNNFGWDLRRRIIDLKSEAILVMLVILSMILGMDQTRGPSPHLIGKNTSNKTLDLTSILLNPGAGLPDEHGYKS